MLVGLMFSVSNVREAVAWGCCPWEPSVVAAVEAELMMKTTWDTGEQEDKYEKLFDRKSDSSAIAPEKIGVDESIAHAGTFRLGLVGSYQHSMVSGGLQDMQLGGNET